MPKNTLHLGKKFRRKPWQPNGIIENERTFHKARRELLLEHKTNGITNLLTAIDTHRNK